MEENGMDMLISRYLNGTATALEKARVERWYNDILQEDLHWPLARPDQTDELKASLWQSLSEYAAKYPFTAADQNSLGLRVIARESENQINDESGGFQSPEQIKLNKSGWKRWSMVAAAALLIIGLGTGLYRWLASNEKQTNAIVATDSGMPDIAPGHKGALLTLADGRVLSLDSVQSQRANVSGGAPLMLARQGGNEVALSASGLIYRSLENEQETAVTNSLATPNGRQYNLTLADGTKVWLNAGSRLNFPTAFSGKERRVKLFGEAYFEVAKNPSKPFIVQAGSVQVKVLGTHFNVRNYQEENTIKTTLIEGSVQVKKGTTKKVITPGWQAAIKESALAFDVRQVDTLGVISWKNGYFHFEHADIKSFMQQVARWYDLDVHFEDAFRGRFFSGELEQNQPFSNVVEYLRNSGMKVLVEGHRVTIEK